MNARWNLNDVINRFEGKLAALEGRFSQDDGERGRIPRGQVLPEATDRSLRNMKAEELWNRLGEAQASLLAREKEYRQQQQNIARLVKDWEERISRALEDKTAAEERADKSSTENARLQEEVRYLRLEGGRQEVLRAALDELKEGSSRVLQAKDEEIGRLSARIRDLEAAVESAALERRRHTHRRRRSRSLGHRVLGWLSKPLIEVETYEYKE